MTTANEARALRVLKLFTDQPFTHTGSHLRGTLVHQFPDRQRLHGHNDEGQPQPAQIRYLVRNRVPCVVGLDVGRRDLLELYDTVEELVVPNESYRVTGKELIEVPLEIGPAPGLHTYRFVTPWIALNQSNHEKFRSLSSSDRKRQLLESIAVGNVLTAARAAGVTLPREPRVEVRLVDWSQRPIEVTGQKLLGFKAVMVTNLRWSPWLGLGKMVSKGFGLLELE